MCMSCMRRSQSSRHDAGGVPLPSVLPPCGCQAGPALAPCGECQHYSKTHRIRQRVEHGAVVEDELCQGGEPGQGRAPGGPVRADVPQPAAVLEHQALQGAQAAHPCIPTHSSLVAAAGSAPCSPHLDCSPHYEILWRIFSAARGCPCAVRLHLSLCLPCSAPATACPACQGLSQGLFRRSRCSPVHDGRVAEKFTSAACDSFITYWGRRIWQCSSIARECKSRCSSWSCIWLKRRRIAVDASAPSEKAFTEQPKNGSALLVC